MSYRKDKDLEFIGTCKDSELEDLFRAVIYDKNGNTRMTELLTVSEVYKTNVPHHSVYWQELCEEIQKFGGNTIANLIRGDQGVLYREILEEVCDKFKVNYSKENSTARIECYLLQKIFDEAVEQMSEEERERFCKELGVNNTSFNGYAEALHFAALTAFKLGGFTSYKIAVIVANWVWRQLFNRGLSFAAGSSLTRILGMWAGPVGWSITILWSIFDIAGPAYRVTIPAVIQIALLRQKKIYESQINVQN